MNKLNNAVVQMERPFGELSFRRNRNEMLLGRSSSPTMPWNISDDGFSTSKSNSVRAEKVEQAVGHFIENISPMISSIADSDYRTKLSGLFMDILKRDILKSADSQRFLDKYTNVLRGFEFNNECTVSNLLKNQVQVERMDSSPTHRVRLPIFSPNEAISKNSSHLQISVAAVIMNLDQRRFHTQIRQGQHRPLTHLPIIAETISFDIPRQSDAVLSVIVSVRSFQKIGEQYHFVEHPRCNASALCYIGRID